MSQDKRDKQNADRAASSGKDRDDPSQAETTRSNAKTDQSNADPQKPAGSSSGAAKTEPAGQASGAGDRPTTKSGSSADGSGRASESAQTAADGKNSDSAPPTRRAGSSTSGKNTTGSNKTPGGQKKADRDASSAADPAKGAAAAKQSTSGTGTSTTKTGAGTTKSQARSSRDDSKSNQSSAASAPSGASAATTTSTSGQHKTPASTATGSHARGAGTTGGGRTGGPKGGGARPIGLVVAMVALVIAIVAAACTGYLWYHSQQRSADLDSRIHTVEKSQQHNVQKVVLPKLSDMYDRISQFSQRVDKLSQALNQRKQQIGKLQQSIQHVQTQNRQLADQLGGNNERFVEQRIALLLEAANQRLQIDRDPRGAARALSLADQAIQRSGDPELHPVRAKIADEMAALKALPHPDIEGASLKLSNAIQQVPELPLKSNVPSSYQPQSQNNGQGGSQGKQNHSAESAGAELSRKWHQFWNSVGSALSRMVTIRRANGTENAPALMAPDQSYFLTRNLQLQLRAARLALLNGNGQTYHDTLSKARDWIQQYFDTHDSRVSAVLDDLSRLSHVQLDWQAPDLSASLKTLRGIMRRDHNNKGGAGSSETDDSGSAGGQ